MFNIEFPRTDDFYAYIPISYGIILTKAFKIISSLSTSNSVLTIFIIYMVSKGVFEEPVIKYVPRLR